MMKKRSHRRRFRQYLLLITILFAMQQCKQINNDDSASKNTIELKNGLDTAIKEQVVTIGLEDIKNADKNWNKMSFHSEEEIPFQWIDKDDDGTPEEALLLVSIDPNATKEISIKLSDNPVNKSFTKRTQAQLSIKENGAWEGKKYVGGNFKDIESLTLPKSHTDHSEYIRCEGPIWESDKMGYRFYLDWRNATDVFGKKTTDMVLQDVGQDGFSSYHEEADWGMDILKVGKSLGIGAIGFWDGSKAVRIEKTDSVRCDIVEDGILQSKIKTQYYGWEINDTKTTLVSNISIQAGDRLSFEGVSLSESLPNICTGIVKHEKGKLMKKEPDSSDNWGYIATYGNQSLNDDEMGMVVFFKGSDFISFETDEYSHIVVLKPSNNQISYYFGSTWSKEPNGITSEEAFNEYLQTKIKALQNPLSI